MRTDLSHRDPECHAPFSARDVRAYATGRRASSIDDEHDDSRNAAGAIPPSHRRDTANLLKIHCDSLRQTSLLSDYIDWENVSATRNGQNDSMAEEILAYSTSDIPPSLIESRILDGYIGNAIDLRPYKRANGSLGLSKIDDITGIWGGLLRMPTPQIRLISQMLLGLGKTLSAIESPVILVAATEGPLSKGGISNRLASPSIGETLWVADRIAEGLRIEGRTPHVVNFQNTQWLHNKNEINYLAANDPAIIFGNFDQLKNAMRRDAINRSILTVSNGQVLFSGRAVDCVLNERLAHYIQEINDFINPHKTLIGPLIDLGTNKAAAYAAHNAFMEEIGVGANFPSLAHEIAYTACPAVDALNDAARSFAERGLGFVCKPTGTIGGHGVIVVKPGDFNPGHFPLQVAHSLAELGRIYNRHGTVAGMPYVVSEYIESPKICVPSDMIEKYGHLHGCEYEMRVGICTREIEGGQRQFVAVPNVFKIQLKGSTVASGVMPIPGNGRRYDEYVLPALNDDALRLTGISEKLLYELAKFSSAYQLRTLNDLSMTSTQFWAMKQRAPMGPTGTVKRQTKPDIGALHPIGTPSDVTTPKPKPQFGRFRSFVDTWSVVFRRLW